MSAHAKRKHKRMMQLVQAGRGEFKALQEKARRERELADALAKSEGKLAKAMEEWEGDLREGSDTMANACARIDFLVARNRELNDELEAMRQADDVLKEQYVRDRDAHRASSDELMRRLHAAGVRIAELEKRLAAVDADGAPKLRKRLARKTTEIAELWSVIRRLQGMLRAHGQTVVFQRTPDVDVHTLPASER